MEETRGLLARKGRLVRREPAWARETARELAGACVLRARDRAVQALAGAGMDAEADALSQLDRVIDLAPALAGLRGAADSLAGGIVAYAADAAEYASCGLPEGDDAWTSCTAYVSALHAGLAACGDPGRARHDPAYDAERRWQAEWLKLRLGLADDGENDVGAPL
jgi:hypothetical protein